MATNISTVNVSVATTTPITTATRIRAFTVFNAGAAGILEFKDGGASGTVKMRYDVPSSLAASETIDFADAGISFETSVYVSQSATHKVLIQYG